MESHLRMLERLNERAGADPAIGLLAALVRLDLAPDDGASTKLRAAIRRLPADGRLPARLKVSSGGLDCPRRQPVSVRPKFHR